MTHQADIDHLPIARLEPGQPFPLGATWDGRGVNFALFSAFATQVELCLFDTDGKREVARISLRECSDQVWHGYLPDARPGLLYGYRAHGPNEPGRGHRFDPGKLLIDPYARAFAGTFEWVDADCGTRIDPKSAQLSPNGDNDALATLKCRVVDPTYPWKNDRAPRTAWSDTVIYEVHAKGYSMTNPAVPEALRGTYAGLAHPASIAHLQRLGVTAVELLPVHEFIDERRLMHNGLRNYWGYNSLGFFAAAARYAGGADPMREFRSMVMCLHAAGIEVILDVVYNHTCEADDTGPILSFRGIDNASY